MKHSTTLSLMLAGACLTGATGCQRTATDGTPSETTEVTPATPDNVATPETKATPTAASAKPVGERSAASRTGESRTAGASSRTAAAATKPANLVASGANYAGGASEVQASRVQATSSTASRPSLGGNLRNDATSGATPTRSSAASGINAAGATTDNAARAASVDQG